MALDLRTSFPKVKSMCVVLAVIADGGYNIGPGSDPLYLVNRILVPQIINPILMTIIVRNGGEKCKHLKKKSNI